MSRPRDGACDRAIRLNDHGNRRRYRYTLLSQGFGLFPEPQGRSVVRLGSWDRSYRLMSLLIGLRDDIPYERSEVQLSLETYNNGQTAGARFGRRRGLEPPRD